MPRSSSSRTPRRSTRLVALLLLSGRITVCTQCAARRDMTEADLLRRVW